MNCPRCNTPGSLAGTGPGKYGTLRRAYVCASAHRFSTLEVTEPPGAVARHQLGRALRAASEALRAMAGA